MTIASDILDLIERLRAEGGDFCIATVVRTANLTSAKAGAKAVVTPDGEVHGFVGGGCVTGAVRKAALEAMRVGAPEMIRIRPREEVAADMDADGAPLYKSGCPSGGTVEIFLEPMRSAHRIVICGASPVAQALVAIGKASGFVVVHAADDEEHVAGADAHIDGVDLTGANLSTGDSVVIATQGRRDRTALQGALTSPAAYVSMIGSRRKVSALTAEIVKAGAITERRIAELRGPAGLDIGAVGPEEIALSIVAEIISCLRRPDQIERPATRDNG